MQKFRKMYNCAAMQKCFHSSCHCYLLRWMFGALVELLAMTSAQQWRQWFKSNEGTCVSPLVNSKPSSAKELGPWTWRVAGVAEQRQTRQWTVERARPQNLASGGQREEVTLFHTCWYLFILNGIVSDTRSLSPILFWHWFWLQWLL